VRFDTIEDPADPAWVGHAEFDAPWWRRGRVLGVIAGVAIVVASLAFLVGWGDDDAPQRREASASGSSGIEQSPVSAPTTAEVVKVPGDTSAAAGLEPATEPAETAGGSGWAPVDATKDGSESGRLTGDLSGTTPALRQRLERLAIELDVQLEFVSGWRTRHEQADLYRRFLNGTGNLAAVPGTSRHEIGYAADVYVDGTALADYPGVKARARRLGLHFPVGGEAWHVELIETARM
jgi:hypothetical protein